MSYRITLIPGDGSGPDEVRAAESVLEATGIGFEWEEFVAGEAALEKYGTPLPEAMLESIRRNKVALKGPLTTPIGTGFRSVNVAIRQRLDLYACLRPFRSFKGVRSPFGEIDLVVVRENTEGLYAGIEHRILNVAAEAVALTTRFASERIVRFAFEYAKANRRNKVTAIHKANILKLSDGLFLEVARSVAEEYPEIEFADMLIDAACMQLVRAPERFEVLVLPNLYGDIVSDLVAGLVGGLGLAPGANLGEEYAVFEPSHGSAPKYAGLDKINPTATILSAAMMLRHLGESGAAQKVEKATTQVIEEGRYVTYDICPEGRKPSTTSTMAEAIADRIGDLSRSP